MAGISGSRNTGGSYVLPAKMLIKYKIHHRLHSPLGDGTTTTHHNANNMAAAPNHHTNNNQSTSKNHSSTSTNIHNQYRNQTTISSTSATPTAAATMVRPRKRNTRKTNPNNRNRLDHRRNSPIVKIAFGLALDAANKTRKNRARPTNLAAKIKRSNNQAKSIPPNKITRIRPDRSPNSNRPPAPNNPPTRNRPDRPNRNPTGSNPSPRTGTHTPLRLPGEFNPNSNRNITLLPPRHLVDNPPNPNRTRKRLRRPGSKYLRQ